MAERGWSLCLGHRRAHSQDQGLYDITWCTGGWDSTQIPWYSCWTLQLSQRYFGLWTGFKLLLLRWGGWWGGQKWEISYSAMMLCFVLCFWISMVLQSLSNIGVNSGLPEVAPSLHATHFLGMLYKRNHDSLATSFWPSAEPRFSYSRFVWPSWQQRLYVIHLCVLRLQESGRAYGECSIQVCGRNKWMSGQIITLVWNLRGFISRQSSSPWLDTDSPRSCASFRSRWPSVIQRQTDSSKPHAFSEWCSNMASGTCRGWNRLTR